jgi:AhpD family alkylhydroperoxidase
MPDNQAERFSAEREELHKRLQEFAGTGTKRMLTIDHQAYEDGALPAKTKELLGLVASAVLRCDDCISYHLQQCHACGVDSAELEEALHIALVVGGSITIPHLRRAVAFWDGLQPARQP